MDYVFLDKFKNNVTLTFNDKHLKFLLFKNIKYYNYNFIYFFKKIEVRAVRTLI